MTKTIAAALLSLTALGATAGSASAMLLPAVQSAREAGRLSAPAPQECWDWTNEDGTTGTECR